MCHNVVLYIKEIVIRYMDEYDYHDDLWRKYISLRQILFYSSNLIVEYEDKIYKDEEAIDYLEKNKYLDLY